MTLKDKRPPDGVGAGNAAFGKAVKSSADYTTLQAALFYIPAGDRNTWVRMGMAVKSELGDGGFDLWDEWSRTADNYDPKGARTTWRSITPDGGVTIGTLYHEAQQHGFRFNGETRPQPPTAEEIAVRDRREQENEGARQRAQEDAAKKAEGILEAATGDPTIHPYAVKKRVPFGPLVKRGLWPQRGWGDALLVPIYGSDGRVWSIEAINSEPDADGKFPKDSLKHGKKIGGFYPLGKVRGASCVFIAEGVANAAVGAEVDKSPAVAAMGKSNLKAAALAVRELAPDAELIILTDNDLKLPKEAHEAAVAVCARVVVPELDGRKCDFWDLWNERGPAAVHAVLSTIEAAIAKLAVDVGAVFEADVVAALKATRERNPAEYQRYRKRVKDAGASVGELDRLVCASGGDGEEAAVKGRKIVLYQPEPWPKPVNGAEVLDEALTKIKRHMAILKEHAVGAVLWAAHTHVYNVYAHTPRLLINAPEAECGKTLLLFHLVGALVPRPQAVELMKPAPFFRLAEEFKPCFLIDEVDVFIKEDSDLLAAINNGWEPQGGVPRCVGEDFEVRIFSTHTPVAMGGVKLHKVLPGTTWSRSIVVTLEKATEAEIVEHYDPRKHRAGLLEVGRKLARWCSDNANALRRAEPTLPGNAYNRRADKWRPLFAIAELAGGEWPDRARHAFLSEEQDGGVNGGVALDLLADIRELLRPHEHVIATKDLIGRLCALEESWWAEYNYREREPDRRCIRGRQLSGLLKDYRIKPGTVRLPGDSTPKGYKREDLERVFLRYLPPLLSATPPQMSHGAGFGGSLSATNEQSVADKKTPKPVPHKDCGGVADQKGGSVDISQTEAWSRRI